MYYVERNQSGDIIALYGSMQAYAQEYLEDDDPAVIAFLNPPEKKLREFQSAIELHVDNVAASKSYANALSLAGYATSTVPQWQAETIAFVAWRDQVWVYSFTELSKFQNGEREIPTIEEFIAELPQIQWPD